MTQHKETNVADAIKFILKVTIGTYVLVNLVIATEIVINSLFPQISMDTAGSYIFDALLFLTIVVEMKYVNTVRHSEGDKDNDND